MNPRTFISPKEFLDAFVIVAAQHHNSLSSQWLEFAAYTRTILGIVLPEVASRLQLLAWPKEYYYLDSVFYKEKDSVHFREESMNVKYFEVALEHEHVLSGTAQEINKLQLINAPLKVLITYDAKDSQRDQMLKKYETIISAADIFDDIASKRRQLVIFGRKPARGDISWSGYAYEQSGFVQL